MNPNVKEITDKDLIIKAKKIGIKKPNTMSTKKTVKYAQQTAEKTQITQNLQKIQPFSSKNIDERQNPAKSDLRKAKTLHNKSLSDLQRLAKLR